MKVSERKSISRNLAGAAALSAAALLSPQNASALPLSHYAENSMLAEGTWHKIRVARSGMQLVSNAQLAAMGFTDPSRVNVYGYGGRIISETLDAGQVDDLPMLPCIRTASGIVFFGVDHMEWEPFTGKGGRTWTHTMQPYSENSYYFLSDRQATQATIPSSDRRDTSGLREVDSFFERQVHEADIFAPAETGRNLFGEDLRDGGTKSFTFQLPGNIGGEASAYINIASYLSGSGGSLSISSPSGRVSANSLTIPALSSSTTYYTFSPTRITVAGCSDKLQLDLAFRTSGTTRLARLDYIEVEYERQLALSGGQLYFYLNESGDRSAEITGCSSETQIWDVTERHAPVQVNYTLSGGTARFRAAAGSREYVAFNPSQVNIEPSYVCQVGNQNLHALPVPDMLIVTPPEYVAAAEKVASLHREMDDMTVHILTPEHIYNEFSSGNPDVSAFRKILKMWYDRGLAGSADGTSRMRYCLLMTRPTYDNKMATPELQANPYPRIPIWQSFSGNTETTSYSTDDFIGMLEDDRAFSIGAAKIQVAVGRFPVRSAEEAMSAATKLENYVKTPITGPWRNNLLILADDQDSAVHATDANKLRDELIACSSGDRLLIERLYLDTFPMQKTSTGAQYPLAKQRLFSKLDEGQALMVYVGHANTVSWTHEQLLNWNDINSFSNRRMPVLYAPTCEFARWDANAYSGGEVLWANPDAGIIAGCIPSRSVLIYNNGKLSLQVGKYLARMNADGTAPRLGDVFRMAKNNYGVTDTLKYPNDTNKLSFCLLGDPAMKMPLPENIVQATAIMDTDIVSDPEDLPVIKARGAPLVKGIVCNPDGSKATDFNGKVYLTLLDAEKPVTTLGNPDPAKNTIITYNDRKTVLFSGISNVTEGEWKMTLLMPSEIENNWSPGRMTFYAIADDGREANGATEKFYVYGYDYDAAPDDAGPEIQRFTLNSDSFRDGDIVANAPVVFATVFDESGINLSDTGIGHSLLLTLDGETVFSDLSTYFTADTETPGKGSLAYQLPEISAGKHTLRFSVWDNANNSSYAELNFNVGVSKQPDIYELTTDCNPASTSVVFAITSDRAMASLGCTIEVFDLNGKKVWSRTEKTATDTDCAIHMGWDLKDFNGSRVERGIYLYRATIETSEGFSRTKTKRLAVTAQ